MCLIQSELQNWKTKVEWEKTSFSTQIFSLVENNEMAKLDAVVLILKYKLLPIHPWVKLPKFAEDWDHFDRYSTINYVDLLCEADFNPQSKWARFPEITMDEAIDQVWNIVKDEGVIGCIFDW